MYGEFAKVYDGFMDNIPYEQWREQITGILKKHGIDHGIVADLGCGTGTLTEMLSRAGYDMIGIDCSEEMLQEALERRDGTGSNILYLCQDMRSFELYGTCAAMVSRCDSINYLTSYEDLVACLKLVNNYLDPKGLFIFDVKTEFMYKELLGYNTFARNNDDGSYIWENAYDEKRRINQYLLTLYIREDSFSAGDMQAAATDNLQADADNPRTEATGNPWAATATKKTAPEHYIRIEELHEQKAFTMEELQRAAREAGLLWIDAMDSDTEGPVEPDTTRVLITLQEQGK